MNTFSAQKKNSQEPVAGISRQKARKRGAERVI